MNAKQFVTASAFVSEENGLGSAFANQIKSEDLVAVTVTVDADRGVANQIAPGDHVNIAAKGEGVEGDEAMRTVHPRAREGARGRRVDHGAAAVATELRRRPGPPPTNSGVLTFEVTKEQALQVINANNGRPDLPRAPGAGHAVPTLGCRQGRGERQVTAVESYATVDAPVETTAFDVAVVEPDANLRTRLAVELAGRSAVRDHGGSGPAARPGAARRGGVRAWVRQPDRLPARAPASRARTRRWASVFAVYELSTDVLQQALRAGARDAVVIGGEASLHQSVDRVGELLAGAVDRAPCADHCRTRRAGSPHLGVLDQGWRRQDLRRHQRGGRDGEALGRTGRARRRRPPVRRRRR